MGRSKKRGKGHGPRSDPPKGIRFELEEDAEELFRAHLSQFKPERKDDEGSLVPERPSGRRKAKPDLITIDLHGYLLDEAQSLVEAELDALLLDGGLIEVKIITGKGRHSQSGGGILAREIHRFVEQRYRAEIQKIEASPDEVRLQGLPIRGHFHVTLRGKSLRKR
jgi:DNA-nicking Smr family endonuclease